VSYMPRRLELTAGRLFTLHFTGTVSTKRNDAG
jgi:hypothetical protein